MSAHDHAPAPGAGTNDNPNRPERLATAETTPDAAVVSDPAPAPTSDQSQLNDATRASACVAAAVPTDVAAALAARLDSLGARLEARLDDAVIQREGFDRLYDDFDRCRKQESLALVLPWINGLIRLHDNIGKTRDALAATNAPDPASELAERHLAGVEDELEVLLENNGVTIYREADERFNSRRQSVITLVPTTQADDDGCIAARVRPGFELGERLLRKERVRVYKHRPEMPDSPAPDPEHSAE